MNETDREDRKIIKKLYTPLVIILTVFELFAMVFFAIIFSILSNDFGSKLDIDFALLRNCFLIGIPVIAVIVDIALYNAYKKRFALMKNIKAVDCVIEDMIFTSYLSNHKRRYKIYPVVKNTRTGELYCTFEKYNMSFYSSVQARNANSLLAANIVRSDGSAVNLGDPVRVYIKEFVGVNVSVNPDNTYSLNGHKHKFNHANQRYDINFLNKLKYFSGIIDVER